MQAVKIKTWLWKKKKKIQPNKEKEFFFQKVIIKHDKINFVFN